VLNVVKQRLRAFVSLAWVPLYAQDEDGDWVEVEVVAEEETEHQVLQREFVFRVNERLAELGPFCRRLLRWHYLDQLRAPDIMHLEGLSRPTLYRRLQSCSAGFRARLERDRYFAELVAKLEAFSDAPRPDARSGDSRYGRVKG
jgi:DNA-directed RNA polymerase specialized sigma24 family protein